MLLLLLPTCREALLQKDVTSLAQLMDMNFDLRRYVAEPEQLQANKTSAVLQMHSCKYWGVGIM